MVYKLAIVGSSVLDDKQEFLAETLIEVWICQFTPQLLPLEVASGEASGVDTIAKNVAQSYDQGGWVSYQGFPPLHPRWLPDGYRDRNLRIAEYCDSLLCIRSIRSKTYGSGWTADRAEELGKPVYRYYV